MTTAERCSITSTAGRPYLGEEGAHKGRQGLVVLPLSLRGDGVEDQRRLPGAGDSGDHGQAALGNLDVDPGQVVLTGPEELLSVR